MRSASLCIRGLLADRVAAAATPALQRLLSRALESTIACDSLEGLLCEWFGVGSQPDLPVGALSLLGDGGEPGKQTWLRADPVHLQPDQGALILRAARHLAIEPAEAQSLVAALDAHFEADGVRFLPLRSDRWYASLPGALAVRTRALSAVDGCSIDPLLPVGTGAVALHRLCNEAQMLLHAHPVNDARELRGEPAINSVWLWGAGALPEVSRPAFDAAWGDDPLLRGLCVQVGLPLAPVLDARLWLEHAGQGRHLIVTPDHAVALEQDWFGPLLAALRSHALDELAMWFVTATEARCCAVSAGDLWKFWRSRARAAKSAHA